MNKEFTPPLQIAFVERWHEYDDVYTYVFRPKKKLTFIAGQNARIVIPGIEGDESKRSFSLASPPHEREIQFSLHTGPGSEFKQALADLTKGDEINLIKIKGKTLLPTDTSIPIVLIAGGIGITPFRSILLHATHYNLPTTIVLIHVSSGAYLYEDELKKLPFDQKRIRRRDVLQTVSDTIKELPHALYFVVGPPPFLETVEEILQVNGVSKDAIRISRFTGYENLFD